MVSVKMKLILAIMPWCDAFLVPNAFVVPMGGIGLDTRVRHSAKIQAFEFRTSLATRTGHVAQKDEIRKRRDDEHCTKMQSNGLQLQPIFGSDYFGGGGMYGGGWGGRNNLGDGEFHEERGAGRRLHLRMMQGLLAVRGGDHFLTAEATLFNSRAPATNALLCINAIVYLLQVLTQGALLTAGAKMNSAIVMGQYYRLLTPVFLHGGLLHLLCNALSLNAVGPMVETLFDTERMVFTYICAGIGGNVASFVFGPQAMSVGASGAIFGLVGALGVYMLRHRELYGERSDRILNAIMQTCALNLLFGLIPGSRIDNFAHFGGCAAGALVAYIFGPNLKLHMDGEFSRKGRSGGLYYKDEPLVPLPSFR